MKEISNSHPARLGLKTLQHFQGSLPSYETLLAAGMDLRAALRGGSLCLKPLQRVLVPTGICLQIPRGFEVQIRPRSGWALKKGVTVLNAPGTIDADYRGEIQVLLINLGGEEVLIQDQDRIAQMVLSEVSRAVLERVEELDETVRGSGGFGSTGLGP